MNKKKILEYHQFFLKETESSSFKKYEQNLKKERESSADYFDFGKTYCSEVVFTDVCSNEDITKLIKQTYKLPKSMFSIRHRFKKPGLFRKYCYIHLSNGRRESGIFEEISFLKDEFIKRVEILWSQINNYYALLEYKIIFKKPLSDDDICEFVNKNIGCFTNKDFVSNYCIKKDRMMDYLSFDNYIYDRFVEICQHFITTFLYSKYAKKYSLPVLVFNHAINKMDLSLSATEHSFEAYYNKKDNFIIYREPASCRYQLISQDCKIPYFSISNFIMNYGMVFYYHFFGWYELNLFNYEFTRYTSHKRNIPFSKLISLLNRSQGLKEEINYTNYLETEFNDKWVLLYGGKEEKPLFDNDYYSRLYNNSFDYFRSASELYSTRMNKWIAIAALVVSFASLIVAIITLFTTK